MNKLYLIGNVTQDIELSETESGVSLCRFSLAVNRSYKNAEGERDTDFFTCTAWRGQAETLAKYVKKGNKLAVVGSVELRNYEDKEGVKRLSVDVVVEDVEFLTPKPASAGDN